MNYELAKQLKEAGYPQIYKQKLPLADFAYDSKKTLHLLHHDNDTDWWIGNDYSHSEMTAHEMILNWVKAPTLEELIEACGDISLRLQRIKTMPHEEIFWQVDTGQWGNYFATNENRGSTPLEAVANLYLQINKK